MQEYKVTISGVEMTRQYSDTDAIKYGFKKPAKEVATVAVKVEPEAPKSESPAPDEKSAEAPKNKAARAPRNRAAKPVEDK